ncbi:unnamed protein product, partial [Mesorhabditis belari]|uniref:Uncharacterized protein n=1 Tax=Mesorhabditis belari TaxID=2138241 RepID=A0AAF3F0X1_9BILA
MGVKEVDRKQRSVPTSDQIRLAKLTLTDGGAMDEDQEVMKRLIKKVIETTLCTKAQAEIALFDNDNDADAAVLQILENPDLNWTEQKNKKDKKKEDENVKPVRGQSSTRGRSGQTREWTDRANGNRGKSYQGGGNASSTTTRGPDSRGAARGENGRGGGRGNNAVRQQRENKDAKVTPTENGGHEENHDWKSGPLVFKRTEESTATATESTTSVPSIPVTNGSTSTGPISFAAAAAAGVNKERHRQQQQQRLIAHVEESKPSVSVEEVARIPPPVEVEAESSLNTCISLEEEPLDINQPTSTTTDWASKLKADLGIGVPAVESFGPPEVANPVEFMSDAATSFSGLQEYQFGFNSEPVESILPSSPANQSIPAVQMPEAPLFTRSPIVPSSSQTIPPKTETLPPQNGEFSNLKSSPPSSVPVSSYAQHMQQQQQPRTLSYDSSSVSYAPPDGRAALSKPPTTQPIHVQNPPPTHQMPYAAPQMQYPNYPYLQNVNMYSPALRNDDANFAAAALMQYPFGISGGQIDLSQLLPQGALSAGQSQQVPQQQHRNDNPQMMDLNKFQGGVNSGRDSAVGPPPGFANPSAAYMAPHAQQNLQNLFMQQQQYGPSGPFPYIMQPTVNQARQMYGGAGDEERKNFERNAGKQGGAQQTPPPHYQQHNGYMQGLGKPKPQQYGHTNSGWN